MTEDDRGFFGEQLALLSEVFNERVSALRAAAYWEVLHDLPLLAVRTAVRQLLQNSRFFPKPVEIRTAAAQSMHETQVLLMAPSEMARAITDAAATKERTDAVAAAADAEAARWAALSPAEQEAERQAAQDAERRRVEKLHALWAEDDRARRAHARPRYTATRPDDPTVQRCPKCNGFRITPDVTGTTWRCAHCQTLCDA